MNFGTVNKLNMKRKGRNFTCQGSFFCCSDEKIVRSTRCTFHCETNVRASEQTGEACSHEVRRIGPASSVYSKVFLDSWGMVRGVEGGSGVGCCFFFFTVEERWGMYCFDQMEGVRARSSSFLFSLFPLSLSFLFC